jgi:hypothetical protein
LSKRLSRAERNSQKKREAGADSVQFVIRKTVVVEAGRFEKVTVPAVNGHQSDFLPIVPGHGLARHGGQFDLILSLFCQETARS